MVKYTAQQLESIYGKPKSLPVATAPEPEQDGIIKSIAKDVAGTLVVKPIAKATEAVTRLVAPNSQAAQGYEQMQAEGQPQNIGGIEVPVAKSWEQGATKQIAGEGLKSASYLFPYGKAAGVAGKALGTVGGNIASGATGGYLADVGMGLQDENQTTGEALTPGLGTAIGAAIPAAAPALRATGRAVKKVGSKTAELAIPTSTREAGILQTYKANNPFFTRVADVLKGTEKAPVTAGKTVVEKGLMGSKSMIGVQSKRAAGKLWEDVIAPRLKASEQAVDLDGFFTKIQDDIIKTNPEASRQKALLNALQSFKDDYAGINSVSLDKLQKLKEGWAEFIPEKAYRGENISGAANQVRKLLANESRQTIYSQLGDDVKQAYFDYGNLQGLQKMGQVAMTGSKLKGGAGSFISELASQAVTPVATIGGQGIYRVGKGIEFIGNLGAKNLGEALGVNIKFPGDTAVDDISKSVKGIKKNYNSMTPGERQRGSLNLGGKKPSFEAIAKKIDNTDKSIMLDVLEGKNLAKGTDLANSYKLQSAFGTTEAIKKDFSAILDAERQLTKSKIAKYDTALAKKAMPADPLIQEAKKYKSAEDIIVYRGGEKFDPSKMKTSGKAIGSYFSTDKNFAKGFTEDILSGKTGKGLENVDTYKYTIKKGANIATPDIFPEKFKVSSLDDIRNRFGNPHKLQDEISKWALKNGFDVIDYIGNGKNMIILNSNIIK